MENHRTNIVHSSPDCTFDIFVALVRDQLCVKSSTGEQQVRRVVSSVFATPNVDFIAVEYVKTAHNASVLSGVMQTMVVDRTHASGWKTSNMVAWYKQYWNIAMCEYMRRRSRRTHDVVLRLRVDTLLRSPENVRFFEHVGDAEIYFVRKPVGYSAKGAFHTHAHTTYWCERVWVTRPAGMDYFLDLVRRPTPLIYDPACKLRCCGFCSEEQSERQLIRANASMRLLHWKTHLVRIQANRFPGVDFVRSRSCHTQ